MKYSEKGPFNDPVLRCDSCAKLVFREDLHELGMCPECGNRKVRQVNSLKSEEIQLMKERGVDPEYFKIFEEVQ